MKKLFIAALFVLVPLVHGQTCGAVNTSSSNTISCTVSGAGAAGTHLELGVTGDNVFISSVSGCGLTPANWQNAVSISGYTQYAYFLYYENAPAFSSGCTITVTATSSVSNLGIALSSHTNIASSFSLENIAAAQNGSFPATSTLTTVGTSDVVVALSTCSGGSSSASFSSSSGYSLEALGNTVGSALAVGLLDKSVAAGSQSNTVTSSQCTQGNLLMAAFRTSIPTFGPISSTFCSNDTSLSSLPSPTSCPIEVQSGDWLIGSVLEVGNPNLTGVSHTNGGANCQYAPSWGIIQPMMFVFYCPVTSTGIDTLSVTGTVPTTYLHAMDVTGLAASNPLWNPSVFQGGTFNAISTPTTVGPSSAAGSCFSYSPATYTGLNPSNSFSASSGYTNMIPGGTNYPHPPTYLPSYNNLYFGSTVSGSSPYTNTLTTTPTITGFNFGIFPFCSAQNNGIRILQAVGHGADVTFSMPRPISSGSKIVVHVVTTSMGNFSLSASPATSFTVVNGCGGSDYQCTEYANAPSSGSLTLTVANGGYENWVTDVFEIAGVDSLRASNYGTNSSGAASSGPVSANAGDLLLALGSATGTGAITHYTFTPSDTNYGTVLDMRGEPNAGVVAQMRIAPTTTSYSQTFTPSISSQTNAVIMDFGAAAVPGTQIQMLGSTQMLGNAQVIP
jgi:hypothetical protein